jgi:hypothetical protein
MDWNDSLLPFVFLWSALMCFNMSFGEMCGWECDDYGCSRRAVDAVGDYVRLRSLRFAPTHIHRPYSRRYRGGCNVVGVCCFYKLENNRGEASVILYKLMSH